MARFALRACIFAAILITVAALLDEEKNCPLNLSANDVAKHSGLDLTGKTALVTGGRSGLGRAITEALLQQNCAVMIASRNEWENMKAVYELMTSFPGANVTYRIFDLESFENVRAFASSIIAEGHTHLDYYFGNAGQSSNSEQKDLTVDGYDQIFQVNYLSQVLLVEELLPLLRKSETSRIMLTASSTHALACGALKLDNGYKTEQTCFDPSITNNAMTKLPIVRIDSGCNIGVYGVSKYLLIQAAIEINKREAGSGNKVLAFPWAPGAIGTELNKAGFWCCFSSEWQSDTCRSPLPNVCPLDTKGNPYQDPYTPYSRTEGRCMPNHGAKAAIYAALHASRHDSGKFLTTYHECKANEGLISQGMTDKGRTKLYNRALVWATVKKNGKTSKKKSKDKATKKITKHPKKTESSQKYSFSNPIIKL